MHFKTLDILKSMSYLCTNFHIKHTGTTYKAFHFKIVKKSLGKCFENIFNILNESKPSKINQ